MATGAYVHHRAPRAIQHSGSCELINYWDYASIVASIICVIEINIIGTIIVIQLYLFQSPI